MYVDCLDLSTVDFTGTGGPPPAHKFVVSAWTINAVKAVLATDKATDTTYGKLQPMAKHAIDYSVFGGPQNFGKWMNVHSAPSCPAEARAPVEHLIGQFASGMTGLIRKLVEGWTSLSGSDSDAVARQFTSFVPEHTHRPTGGCGYDYNNSQEPADTQDELGGDAGLSKDDDDVMENVVKKTTMRGAKHISKDPLERLHSKLSTGGNSDVHEALGDNTAAAPLTAPTNSDASGRPSPPAADVQARTTGIRTSGSDESVSARTTEILPTLLAMKDATVSHATSSASIEVDAPETNLSKEYSCSSDTDSKRVRGGTPMSTTEAAEAAVHKDMPSTSESPGTTAPALVGADTAKATVSRVGLPPRRRSPRKQPTDIPNAPAVARSRRDESGYVPASTLFPPPAKSNVMEKPEDRSTTDAGVKPGTSDAATPEEISPSLDEAYRMIEEAALQSRSSQGQGQSSSNVSADTVSEDTIRSATPSSVRQQRVVHPPPAEDYEPEFRATKKQTQLYDIVKRFGNARASSKHMKELKA
ncbi:hypothetical protein VPH35_047042 [Triticum aestivum]